MNKVDELKRELEDFERQVKCLNKALEEKRAALEEAEAAAEAEKTVSIKDDKMFNVLVQDLANYMASWYEMHDDEAAAKLVREDMAISAETVSDAIEAAKNTVSFFDAIKAFFDDDLQ